MALDGVRLALVDRALTPMARVWLDDWYVSFEGWAVEVEGLAPLDLEAPSAWRAPVDPAMDEVLVDAYVRSTWALIDELG